MTQAGTIAVVDGTRRFLDRVWRIATSEVDFADRTQSDVDLELVGLAHRTLKKVTEDIERFHFNTAVPALMVLSNEFTSYIGESPSKETYDEVLKMMLLMLSPMTPHIAHEIWEMKGFGGMLALEAWPDFDEELAKEEMVMLIVQVNGKVRDRLEVPADITAQHAEEMALASDKIQGWIDGGEVRKVIARPPNLVNLVVA